MNIERKTYTRTVPPREIKFHSRYPDTEHHKWFCNEIKHGIVKNGTLITSFTHDHYDVNIIKMYVVHQNDSVWYVVLTSTIGCDDGMASWKIELETEEELNESLDRVLEESYKTQNLSDACDYFNSYLDDVGCCSVDETLEMTRARNDLQKFCAL